ncbi:hypothetical protein [Paenibacillus alvei]|uniref:hypothetical protein n=1 Tax=Paenibacillus alvei TaxID=44250 RepID=UPI0022814112|nr:hypothetical protein [Paenibacillus alvei]MCY7484308.1 hypothetical protein [Paenibacillus alvei]
MSYYDEDFYAEPSEFEEQIDSLKESLMQAVRDEFKSEMDRLRKENEELKPVKERMKQIEWERKREKQELEKIKADAMKEAKKLRITELLKDYRRAIYTVDSKRVYAPKCEKCDDQRNVEYTTPLGRQAKEECSCKTYTTKYELREVIAGAIEHYSPENGIHIDYYDDQREERVRAYQMFKTGTDYEDIQPWWYFADKEEAQKYCDWLNEQEKAKA